MKKWLIAGSIVAAVSVALAAWADPSDDDSNDRPGRGSQFGRGPDAGGMPPLEKILDNPEIVDRLGLSEEQRTQLRTTLYEGRKRVIRLQADQKLADLEVRHLLSQDNPDEAAVMSAVDAAGRLETDVRKARVAQVLALRKIVGDEKLRQLREEGRERRHQFREDRQGRGRGEGEGRGLRGQGRGRDGEGPAWMGEETMPPPPEAEE